MVDRKDEQSPERDYEAPAVEDLGDEYPVATATGNQTPVIIK